MNEEFIICVYMLIDEDMAYEMTPVETLRVEVPLVKRLVESGEGHVYHCALVCRSHVGRSTHEPGKVLCLLQDKKAPD